VSHNPSFSCNDKLMQMFHHQFLLRPTLLLQLAE
jgi:hypothetical protein